MRAAGLCWVVPLCSTLVLCFIKLESDCGVRTISISSVLFIRLSRQKEQQLITGLFLTVGTFHQRMHSEVNGQLRAKLEFIFYFLITELSDENIHLWYKVLISKLSMLKEIKSPPNPLINPLTLK